MKTCIGKYIYSALSIISRSITVYPVIADFNGPTPTTPFIVYQRTGMEPDYTKNLFAGMVRHTYSVTVVDNDYATCLGHADTVINTMLALTGTTNDDFYIHQVQCTDLSEDFIDGLFTQTIQFEINTTEK